MFTSVLQICLAILCIAVQAEDYDRTKEPQLIYSVLQPIVQDPELCMKLAKLLQGMLDPDLNHRLRADHVMLKMQELR